MNARHGKLFPSALAIGVYAIGFVLGWQAQRLMHRATAAPSAGITQAASGPRPQPLVQDAGFTNRSPFLPDNLTPLQMLLARVKEVDRQGEYEGHFETDELAPLLRALTADEYPVAWSVFKALKSSNMRPFFLSMLASNWAVKAPLAALAAVLTLPKGEEAQDALNSVMAAWAGHDSASALAWARAQLNGKERDQAIGWVIHGLAESDPKAAAALLGAQSVGSESRWATHEVLQNLAPSDLEGATALLKTLDRTDREFALETLAHVRATRDPQQAAVWAQGLPNSRERQAALENVLSTWVETQPEQALQFALNRPDAAQRDKLVLAAVRAWANKDFVAASAWVAQQPAGALPDQGWRTPRNELHNETASSQALALAPAEGPARAVELRRIGRIWSEQTESYQAVQQWAGQLPAKDRDAVLAGICMSLGSDFPEQAVRIAADITSDPERQRALDHAANAWSYTDPEAMAVWSASLPQGAARKEVFWQLALTWSRSDPDAAAQWVASLPADEGRARAADACIGNLALGRPDLAIQCLGLVTDEKRRFQHIEELAEVWLQNDPEAAQTWLEATSLPANRKAKLLKK